MAITIPETMPEDWFGEAEMDRGGIANDPALRHAMEAAYRDGIEEMGVDRIMGRLKDRCMAAAKPTDVPAPPQPVNHELHAESVTSTSDIA